MGCRETLLPLAVVAVLYWLSWLSGRSGANFFYEVPIEEPFVPADAQPTPYPPSFRIRFDTNISRIEETAPPSQPISSMLYYDWTITAQRIEHGAGAYECVRFYNVTTHGCQLYFLKNGMYRVISPDANTRSQPHAKNFQPCCLDIPGLGPPPPDWAQRANPSFQGLKRDDFSGYNSYEFVFDNNSNPPDNLQFFGSNTNNADQTPPNVWPEDVYDEHHTAREVHDGNPLRNGIPLSFTFPSKAKGLQDFHFDPDSMVVGYQEPELFRLPAGCENIICEKSLSIE